MNTTLPLTDNAQTVLENRYLRKNEQGHPIESAEEMFSRVAKNIASAEANYGNDPSRWETAFFEAMVSLEFLPNSPTLMNAATDMQQLSACFVLPVDDSMESIFEAVKHTALIHKSGGGTGFSFSRLRPKNDVVSTTSGVSSGPISFMSVFNAATETVKQGGRRRGANMAVLRVDHPDILEFITAKEDESLLTNFNISVALTPAFMDALLKEESYELINPRTGTCSEHAPLSAKEVFDLIVEKAWSNGEPGILFLDRVNAANPTPAVGEIEATNPCGEQPLLPYESCNLGSINLSRMVREAEEGYEIDHERLKRTVRTAVRFLDNVIDVNRYPLKQIKEMTLGNRKIGLGVMGFADMLGYLRIPYDSEEGVAVAEETMECISRTARQASRELAEERGPFPNFERSVFAENGNAPLRNATCTTIAPTGTLSIIANCSSGVEPIFALAFERHVLDGQSLMEINPSFEKALHEESCPVDQVVSQVRDGKDLDEVDEIPDWMRRVFVTAHDVTPEWHVRMQAAFQHHTDNAVSKTVNFPEHATREDVETVYRLAYELGCKGVTIYRDGSRTGQVLRRSRKKSEALDDAHLHPRPRPMRTTGITEKVPIGCGKLYVTVNSDEDGICEVFTTTGKGGGCPSQSEATARLVSLALRCGIDANSIVAQLRGIRCLSCVRNQNVTVLSCPDAIARTIRGCVQGDAPLELAPNPGTETCPECGYALEHEGGCVVCRECGFSRCG